jgi:hypothetical protein
MSEQDAHAWLSGATLTASSFFDFDPSHGVSPFYEAVRRPKVEPFKFDPHQPRDHDGRWSDGVGGSAREAITDALRAVFNMNNKHNTVIAESAGGDRRMRYHVTPQKYADKVDFVIERRDGDGWKTEESLIGPDAKAKLESESGQWFTPSEEIASDGPSSQTPQPPLTPKVKPSVATPASANEPLTEVAAARAVPQLSAAASDGYVVEGFTWNAWLRGQDERPQYPRTSEDERDAQRGIGKLKREYERAAPLSRPIVVERGISDASLTLPYILGSGKQFTDKGFVSTTTQKGVANSFAMFGSVDTDTAIMRITVPKGFKALRVGPADVGEVLLPPNTQFKVTSDEAVDGVRMLNVEVVGQ